MNLHDRDITRAAKREGILQGIVQGASEAKIEAAKNLLKMQLGSTEQIAQAAGLPLETVLELQQQLN